MEELINSITTQDRLAGAALVEMYECARDEHWLGALSILFLLTEQLLRFKMEADEEAKFVALINSAEVAGIIDKSESKTLHAFRKTRNMYAHASFHDVFQIGDLLQWISEPESAEAVFQEFSLPILRIVVKLVESDF